LAVPIQNGTPQGAKEDTPAGGGFSSPWRRAPWASKPRMVMKLTMLPNIPADSFYSGEKN